MDSTNATLTDKADFTPPWLFDLWTELWPDLLASAIFAIAIFCFLHFFKPNLKISGKICRYKTEDGETKYLLKVYNNSRFFDLMDVQFRLFLVSRIQAPKGVNLLISPINLAVEQKFMLHNRSKKDEYNKHAIVLTVKDDLDTIWNDKRNQHLEFQVSAEHSFSNLKRILREPYTDYDTSIENGKFKTGTTFEIVPSNTRQ